MLAIGQAGSVRHVALEKAQVRAGLRAAPSSASGGTAARTAATTPAKGGARRGSGRQSGGFGTIVDGHPSLDREYVACASVTEQAACLVDLATDPGILAHTWGGWRPWL